MNVILLFSAIFSPPENISFGNFSIAVCLLQVSGQPKLILRLFILLQVRWVTTLIFKLFQKHATMSISTLPGKVKPIQKACTLLNPVTFPVKANNASDVLKFLFKFKLCSYVAQYPVIILICTRARQSAAAPQFPTKRWGGGGVLLCSAALLARIPKEIALLDGRYNSATGKSCNFYTLLMF